MKLFAQRDGSNFGKGESKQNWHINNQFMRVDAFGKEVPAFNIKGNPMINTPIGGFITTGILALTLIYTLVKTAHMVNHSNPVISQFTIPAYYSSSDKLFLKETGFMMAFAIEGFLDSKTKDDPRYVKQFVRVYGKRKGKEYE